jgi:hypothetical protein
MNLRRLVSVSVLSVVAAGVTIAQDAPTKAPGNSLALKAQPMKANQDVLETYGTTNTSFYRMGGSEFTGMNAPGADNWSDTFYVDGTIRRYPTVADGWFVGTPHLPSGALVKKIYIHDCVNDGSTNSLSGTIYACNSYGDSCSPIGTLDTNTGCGHDTVDVSAANYVVNNSQNGNYLVIWIHMTNTDGSDSLAGATIEYQLQVSPAPLVATFSDVPNSDFGFQYIEALVASGITGGTAPGVYSPNQFVTRRQMAIFLAKALGLHFQ